jgi:hypothetical protein
MQKSPQTEENMSQLSEFLFQVSTNLNEDMGELKVLIRTSIESVLKIPRIELPSMTMRTKFKLEDTLKKCV